MRRDTLLITSGRHPEDFMGAVNPPVFRTSTVLSRTLDEWDAKDRARAEDKKGLYYGRFGTPTTQSIEDVVCTLEGGDRTFIHPTGLSACVSAILAYVESGDHVLVTDSVFGPVRRFINRTLKRYGVTTTFYDPHIGAKIQQLVQPNTRVIYLESPGSISFEMQDTAAITEVARRNGIITAMDNTWATPLYFRPLEHGVDVSIQAATKYIVGHSDAMLGLVTTSKPVSARMKEYTIDFGITASSDDAYLAQRGVRTLQVRLARHWQTGLAVAEWLQRQPEVARVYHPALPGDPGHAIWERDFEGASGLFAFELQANSRAVLAAFLDNLVLFRIGASWGGYESLVMPVSPLPTRDCIPMQCTGSLLRVHAGLENVDDLIADLEASLSHIRRLAA